MPQDPSPDEWLVAAQLLRPQGRRGELLAEPHVPFDLFSPGRPFWLAAGSDSPATENPRPTDLVPRTLEGAWQPVGKNAGRVVLKLAGVESISDAEAFNGRSLLLRVGDLPALDEDTFRVRDLVGCSLFDGEVLVGTVVDVEFPVGADGRTRMADAPDLLAVVPAPSDLPAVDLAPAIDALADASSDAETVLIPFVRAWLIDVDTTVKRIRMNLPQGLFGELGPE